MKLTDANIEALARQVAYRYFDLPFDGDPETLIRIIVEEITAARGLETTKDE